MTTDPTPEPAKKRSVAYARLVRNRNFVALWLAQTVSYIGDYFQWLAVPIMVERLTGSALMVGMSVIFNALPMLLLGPVAGVFVDRWDRKRTMIIADLLRAALVLPCLLVKTADQVWIYYLAGFLISCVSRFFFPAQNAVLPLVVSDHDDLLAANGLMQMVQTAGLLIGPALAGFAIGLWGENIAFAANSITFLVSAVAILFITVPRTTGDRSGSQDGQLAGIWFEMREGLAFLFGSRVMVGVLSCLVVVQLGIGALNVVWVPYLQRTFGIGAEGLGIVDSAQGIGMLVGGAALGFVAARLSLRAMIIWSLAVLGFLVGGVGLAPQFGVVVGLSVGIGLALVPVHSALATMMQRAVPDLKRGRVGSALNALTTVASLLSMAVAATFSEAIGLNRVYVVAGLIMVGSAFVGAATLQEPDEQPQDQLAGAS